jgi:hypothetical protein
VAEKLGKMLILIASQIFVLILRITQKARKPYLAQPVAVLNILTNKRLCEFLHPPPPRPTNRLFLIESETQIRTLLPDLEFFPPSDPDPTFITDYKIHLNHP